MDQLGQFGYRPHGLQVRHNNGITGALLRRLTGFELWEAWRVGGNPGFGADTLLCWDERVGVPAALSARPGKEPRIATGVIWLTDRRSPSATRLAREGLKKAYRVWAASSAQLPVLERRFGVHKSRLAHLLFGVDDEFFFPSTPETSSGVPTVCSAGNDRDRDYPTLFRAFADVNRTHPDARLNVATRWPLVIDPRMGTLLGELSHTRLRSEYQSSDVVVIPTRPNLHVSGITAILEAMACGKPVIASDTAGMRDYVTHRENGLLVPPSDPDAMARAIRELLSDAAMREDLGNAGRRAVESKFNTGEQARRLAELLAEG
jgi:glycosyltransferase involved in cell wall biosynthesis